MVDGGLLGWTPRRQLATVSVRTGGNHGWGLSRQSSRNARDGRARPPGRVRRTRQAGPPHRPRTGPARHGARRRSLQTVSGSLGAIRDVRQIAKTKEALTPPPFKFDIASRCRFYATFCMHRGLSSYARLLLPSPVLGFCRDCRTPFGCRRSSLPNAPLVRLKVKLAPGLTGAKRQVSLRMNVSRASVGEQPCTDWMTNPVSRGYLLGSV